MNYYQVKSNFFASKGKKNRFEKSNFCRLCATGSKFPAVGKRTTKFSGA